MKQKRSTPLSRRRFLRAAGAGMVLASATRIVCAQGRKKMTREEAGYEETAEDFLVCSGCALFQEPKYCVILEGEVSPNATCKYYVHVE